MMTPKVSIVVPLYNKAPYIRRTLESIKQQTFGDFEAIVVDDGSTDGGGEIARADADPRFRFVTQKNMGPGAARNAGIKQAQAELIGFLDADDEWLPEYLEQGLAALQRWGDNVASVTFGYFTLPGNKSSRPLWQRRGLTEGRHRLTAATPPELVVSMLAYMSPCSTICRRKVLEKWGGFYAKQDCSYAEDAYLWLKVLLNEEVGFSLKSLTRFDREASSLSGNLRSVRAIEPFLRDPEGIYAACPAAIKGVLGRVLRLRALKTSCVLGYWGYWREARDLVKRFDGPSSWSFPYYVPSLVCQTPLAGVLGQLVRQVNH